MVKRKNSKKFYFNRIFKLKNLFKLDMYQQLTIISLKLQCLKEVVKQKAILHFLKNKAFAGFPHGQEKSGKTKKNDKS